MCYIYVLLDDTVHSFVHSYSLFITMVTVLIFIVLFTPTVEIF